MNAFEWHGGDHTKSKQLVGALLKLAFNCPDKSVMNHSLDSLLTKWPTSERSVNERGPSVIEVKHKWLLSVPDKMQVPAECPESTCGGQAADQRSAPGRDWIPGLNSMNPGAGRDPGT